MKVKILIDSQTLMPKAWICGLCEDVYISTLSQKGYEKAEDCCGPIKLKEDPTCTICGHKYKKNHITTCYICQEIKNLREMKIVEKDAGKYGVFCAYEKNLYPRIDALIDYFTSSKNEEMPFYCHPGKPVTASFDACNIIEHIAYWHHTHTHIGIEDVDINLLQNILDDWTETNPATGVECIDNQIIILDKVRFDEFMKDPLQRTI